jgi:hypothetical protein
VSAPPGSPATFLVCEDGTEYSERFGRLLGGGFRFVRVEDHAQALAATTTAGAGVAGLLLDLDFSRTAATALVDESGAVHPSRPEGERRRLASVQGILILRALRRQGVTLPALLFADLDDEAQIHFLQSSLAPLTVMHSSAGIVTIATALTRMGSAHSPSPSG